MRAKITPPTNPYHPPQQDLMQVWGGGGVKKLDSSIDCVTSLEADFKQVTAFVRGCLLYNPLSVIII